LFANSARVTVTQIMLSKLAHRNAFADFSDAASDNGALTISWNIPRTQPVAAIRQMQESQSAPAIVLKLTCRGYMNGLC